MNRKEVDLYVDGSFDPETNDGGVACLIKRGSDIQVVSKRYTNAVDCKRMEFTALLLGLYHLEHRIDLLHIHTDYKTFIDMHRSHEFHKKSEYFKKHSKSLNYLVSCGIFCREISRMLKEKTNKVKFHWHKGHAKDNVYFTLVDQLSRETRKKSV